MAALDTSVLLLPEVEIGSSSPPTKLTVPHLSRHEEARRTCQFPLQLDLSALLLQWQQVDKDLDLEVESKWNSFATANLKIFNVAV